MKFIATSLCLILSVSFLSSQSWVRQNPFANLSQMYDISFDGKYGLAVGADATIFTTTNYGSTWTQRQPSLLARAVESALVVPGRDGELMLAGGDSIIMVSKDAGLTWKVSYVEVPNLFKIQYLPGDLIIALGKDFGLWSIDDGTTWQPFNFPAFGVTAGHFLDELEGWVALGSPDNVQVWYTSNMGFNWTLRDPQKFPLVTGIEMLNEFVGFLASRDFVYKTIDGGNTWTQLHFNPVDHIQDLFVADEDHIWTSLDNGFIYFSTNGGASWELIDPSLINSNRTLAIWADANGKVWTVGKYLSILHSSDFGQHWTDQLPASKQTLFAPSFYNAFVGMVGGSDGSILRTKNSGGTWLSVEFPINENFFGTAVVDENTAIAGSSSGKVFITGDQGVTWAPIGNGLGQITDLHAFNDQEIVVTNEEGDIYKTKNGGVDWLKVYDGALILYGIDFYDNVSGWAAGINGRIVMTDDGGDTWAVQLNEGRPDFSDIFFTTPQEGWVTSSQFTDSIWHTVDGGNTWAGVALPFKSYWHGVSFMDRDTGWIVGGINGEGYILRTNNLGQTWFLDHTSPDAFREIYSIPNSETAWAVGYGGNIMKYSSCILPPRLIDLRGNLQPCAGDTVNFVVDFEEVDVFDWTFPADWTVIGNTNTASIYFITGDSSGLVGVTGRDACGDTTDQLSAMVIPIPPPEVIIHEDSGVLISNQTSGIFQWFLNGLPIPGATEPTYEPEESGTYQLHFTMFVSGCENTSNEIVFTITSSISPAPDQFKVYPNPAKNELIIQIQGIEISDNLEVTLMGMENKNIFSGKTSTGAIRLPPLPSGLYTLQIRTDGKLYVQKIIIKD